MRAGCPTKFGNMWEMVLTGCFIDVVLHRVALDCGFAEAPLLTGEEGEQTQPSVTGSGLSKAPLPCGDLSYCCTDRGTVAVS